MVRGKNALFALILAGCILLPAVARAAGFGLYEWSARGNALGGALAARVDDASAVAFNPALLGVLEGPMVMAGASSIVPSAEVTTLNPYSGASETHESTDNFWNPPHLYAAVPLETDYGRFGLGLGLYSRFGLGTEFDDDWSGRYNNYNAVIQTLSIAPTISYMVTEWFSLGLGLEAMWMDLALDQKIDGTAALVAAGALPAGAPVNDPSTDALDVDQNIEGDSWGLGLSAAVALRLSERLRLGVVYRSQVEQELSGNADLDKPAALADLPLFEDTGVKGRVILPDSLTVGMAVNPWTDLWLEADLVWTRWSSYDKLKIDYDELSAVGADSVERQKDWNDVIRLALGAEYRLPGDYDWLTLRAGYVFDESPVAKGREDYLVAANDRQLFNLGAGIFWRGLTVDLAYTYLIMKDREVAARVGEGVYDSSFDDGKAHIGGLSLSYAF